jgi:hypothetical protein
MRAPHLFHMITPTSVPDAVNETYRFGLSLARVIVPMPDWLKFKNPEAPAVKREAEEDWGKDR